MGQSRNNLIGNGNQLKDWRGDMLTQTQINAIPISTDAEKSAQEGRKVYNLTTHAYQRFDYVTGAWVDDGGATGMAYKGSLDYSISTETDKTKKNPPALANSKMGDTWVVAKGGVYSYTDKDGTIHSQEAEIGDLFQVIQISPATTSSPEVLDWLYIESATHKIELVIAYDEENPDVKSWQFDSTDNEIWKLGYNVDMYKEEVVDDITTRIPIIDRPSLKMKVVEM